MSDVSGIPNLGIPGMSGFNGGGGVNNSGQFADPGAGLANAYASRSMADRFAQNQAATLAAAQVPQSQLYGPRGFGGDTAHYAGVGAAYGRATGGFKPAAPAGGGGSVFDTGAAPFRDFGLPGGGGAGSFSPSPNYPGGSASPPPSVFDTGTSPFRDFGGRGGMGSFSPSPNYPGGSAGPMPTQPETVFDQAHTPFAGGAGSPGSFGDRFAAGGYFNPGTPSQHISSPYTSAQGRTVQPNIPPGFQTPFSADNPGGALPVAWGEQRSRGAPLMNASGWDTDESADTLTAGDRGIRGSGFGAGASAVPYPYAGGQAFPGGGVGSPNPTNQRDILASIMSGSQGNAGAQNIGRGFGGASPPPMSPFGALPNTGVAGRAFQMPSAMPGASPPAPPLGGGWGSNSVPQTGPVGTSAMGEMFARRSPQSYINSNFGGFDPGTPSAGNIVLSDRLRGQGPPSLSPFMSSNAYRGR